MHRYELTDARWACVAPSFPDRYHGDQPGQPWWAHRRRANGLPGHLHTGAPWRDLPERYGPWQGVPDRFNRRRRDGTRARIRDALLPRLDEQGLIDRDLNALENPARTPVLHWLIRLSSLPMRAVETTFVPDSSGFCTSRFIGWFDVKYGVTRVEAEWVKVYLMTGVKTNIVTAVEIL